MLSEEKIDAAVQALFDGIQFTQEPAGLYDPLRYMIKIGGKRIRPKLCLTTYALYQDSIGPEVLEPAAGLEIFHSFTLIHDDIMDKSPLRRGVATIWKKWGADTAVLSGDVMCIDSYRRIAQAPCEVLRKVMSLFSATAAQVCEGQQYDMEFESRAEVPIEEYVRMIGLKTGALIACAAKMGAIIGGASDADCDNLYEYGYYLGLAFQVADDYLDAFGNERIFGKPIGGDIINNKKSCLTVRAFEKADTTRRTELLKALGLPSVSDEEKAAKIARVKALYRELDVTEDAKYEILRLNEKALEYARKATDGVRYETLRRFAEKLVGRAK